MAGQSSQSSLNGLLARLPGLLTGPGFIAVGAYVFIKAAPAVGTATFKISCALAGIGFLWSILALLLPQGRIWQWLRWASMNLMVLTTFAAVIEVSGRVTKFNFGAIGAKKALQARQAYPIWSREPDKPLPEVYFQHNGPASWTGQPIRALEVLRKGTDEAYVNEPVITVDYDKDGFRNPADLKDWDTVVVGDSYTELGYLPYEDLSTTVAAKSTGMRIKNLGVCDSGLLAYASFLKHFGSAPSCKRVVFVMFEGNDVQDTTAEHEALDRFNRTGERDCKEIAPQYSFVHAVTDLVRNRANMPKPQRFQNAWFLGGGKELPVTVSIELPVNPQSMTPSQILGTKEGIKALGTAARAMNLRASLVYVPVNNRVYHGLLRFADSLPQEIREWKPHDLPEWVAENCKEQGISFHSALPPLRAKAEQGHFLHNRILDCHVNAEGAHILGQVIADALKSDS